MRFCRSDIFLCIDKFFYLPTLVGAIYTLDFFFNYLSEDDLQDRYYSPITALALSTVVAFVEFHTHTNKIEMNSGIYVDR